MQKLTAKQQAFINEYLIDLNATQAAIRAGYSKKTAQEIGAENLSKPIIKDAVEKAMLSRAERVKRTADDVLRDLKAIKDNAMQTFKDETGKEVMLDRSAAIKTLELEGKHLAMWTDKHDHTTNGQSLVPTVIERVIIDPAK